MSQAMPKAISKSFTTLTISLILLVHTNCVLADSRADDKVTVRETLKSKQPGKSVDITGVIIRQVGPNTVLMHDGTAAIEVDIPQEQIPPGGLRSNLRIRIKGQVVTEDEGEKEVSANQAFWSF